MVDPVSASALVIAILSGLSSIITSIHINRCKSGCCESDCSKTPKNTPPNTPLNIISNKEKYDSEMYHKFEDLIKSKLNNEKEQNINSSA